ncbi:MAG: gluconate 2-dehydrogenase subunit 3 family protein, partial [Terriglobia bacterium]
LTGRASAVPLLGADAPETPGAPYRPKFLNPHQWKTLSVLCGLIIPADDRSGSATQAGVPEFIDDFANLRGEKVQTMLSGGLAWLDWRCNRDYANDFADCAPAEQTEALDSIAYPEKAKPEDSFGVTFFGELRGLIMEGFYTSKEGIQDLQYKGNQMVMDWEGCPENVTSRLGVNYSNWEHWKS